MLKQITDNSSTTMQPNSNFSIGQDEQVCVPKPPFLDERLIHLNDFFTTLINSSRAKDQEALGATCKQLKRIADDSNLWRLLLNDLNNFKKMGGNEDPVLPNPSYKSAFMREFKKENPYALLAKINFECGNKSAKSRIDDALKLIDSLLKLPSTDVWMMPKLNLYKAELLMKYHGSANQKVRVLSCINAAFNQTISSEDKIYAQSLQAQYGYHAGYNDDEVLNEKFANAAKNEKLSKFVRVQAILYDCLMALIGKTSSFTGAEAFDRLNEIFIDKDISIDQRAQAALYLAKEFDIKGQPEKADECIIHILKDLDVTEMLLNDAVSFLLEFRKHKPITEMYSNIKRDKKLSEQ